MRITYELEALKKFISKFKAELKDGTGILGKALKDWAFVYKLFTLERYNTFAAGGGDWPPLAPSTVRKKEKKGLDPRILIETGTLFDTLDPSLSFNPDGSSEITIMNGIVGVGFNEDMHAPSIEKGHPLTIAELGGFHQRGTVNMPQREILVSPDKDATEEMVDIMQVAIVDLLERTKNGPVQ